MLIHGAGRMTFRFQAICKQKQPEATYWHNHNGKHQYRIGLAANPAFSSGR